VGHGLAAGADDLAEVRWLSWRSITTPSARTRPQRSAKCQRIISRRVSTCLVWQTASWRLSQRACRIIAEPAALGLAAFALSTMVLSIINLGVLSEAMLPVALGLALAYGGLVQLLAGMWAFIKNDTFSAVALSSYGGFWISFWALNEFFLWIVSMWVSVAVQAVFLTLWIAYMLLGFGKALDSSLLYHLGGAFGSRPRPAPGTRPSP